MHPPRPAARVRRFARNALRPAKRRDAAVGAALLVLPSLLLLLSLRVLPLSVALPASVTRLRRGPPPHSADILRRRHAVPVALVEALAGREDEVLAALRARPWAVFVRLSGGAAGRARAIGSVLAYAENTGRVAVFFWGRGPVDAGGEEVAMREVLEVGEGVVVSDRDVGSLVGWEGLGVVEVGVGRGRKGVVGLDEAAAIEAHVVVTLGESAVTRYAPRMQAARLLERSGVRGRGEWAAAVAGAFVFEAVVARLSDEEVRERLFEEFEVARMMVKGMRGVMVRQLLRGLLLKQSAGVPRPRCVFVHAQFGLGNRLRSLGSAMAFAAETGRVPVLIWVADHHLDCRYSDLFLENDALVVNDDFDAAVDGEWPWDAERAQDENARKMKFYNYMKQNGIHINNPSDAVLNDEEAHIFVKSAYVIQSPSTPSIMHTHSPFWKVLSRSLTPNIAVARLIESQVQMPTGTTMGIHIRSKRIQTDIEGVGVEEYSEESSKRTDYWRNITQVDTFVHEMARQPHDQLFYVAADNAMVLPELQKIFPSRIFYTPRRCDGRDTECLPYALADILILATCRTIRGSYWSSFSEMAVRIGGGRVYLAGVDFGLPVKQETNAQKARRLHSGRMKLYRRKQLEALKMSKQYKENPRETIAMFYRSMANDPVNRGMSGMREPAAGQVDGGSEDVANIAAIAAEYSGSEAGGSVDVESVSEESKRVPSEVENDAPSGAGSAAAPAKVTKPEVVAAPEVPQSVFKEKSRNNADAVKSDLEARVGREGVRRKQKAMAENPADVAKL